MRLSRVVAGGALSGQEALPVLSQVEGTGGVRLDRHMHPTAVCIACGHVRWRHEFDSKHRNICKVPKCPCNNATDSTFAVAEYFGNPAK